MKPFCVQQDTTFEMERQRNKPVKYNRELVHKSVKAMQKVEEVGWLTGCHKCQVYSSTLRHKCCMRSLMSLCNLTLVQNNV